MRISEHFTLREFIKDGRQITPVQVYLLEHLCDNVLEPMRDFLGCKIKVTSGVRFPSDLNRLRSAGYNPSEISDHLFGNVVKVKKLKHKKVYGDYYGFSTGAVDIIPACGALTAWERMKPFFKKEGTIVLPERIVQVKQIILEKGRDYWLHVANPASVLYSENFIKKYLNKPHYLKSLNNGKNYEQIKI